jgi:hypothetical protein
MFTATFLSLPLALIKAHLARSQTCFSTYDVGNNNTNNCYGLEYANDTEASIIDFTESVVRAQIQYPTYTWLSNAGITPSNSTGYNLTSIQSVLTKASGAVPYVRIGDCDHVLYIITDAPISSAATAPPSRSFPRVSCSVTLPRFMSASANSLDELTRPKSGTTRTPLVVPRTGK